MRRLLAFTFHVASAGIMAWGWYSLYTDTGVGGWMKNQKGGYFLWLTNQGLVIACSCMVVSLFCDAFPSVTTARQLKRALLMISMPLEFVISSIYWSLILFLPHLILFSIPASNSLPGATAKVIRLPLTTDLAMHASPFLTLFIDFFVFEPKFSKAQVNRTAPVVVAAFSVWYASFVEYCATLNGWFPYPFLTHNPFMVRLSIYITAAGIALACFRTINGLHA